MEIHMATEGIAEASGRTLLYRSVGRTLGAILGGLALIAAAVFFVVSAIPDLPNPVAVFWLLVGGVALLLFVPGVGYMGRLAAQRRPVLEIGPDGILDRRLSPKILPWSAVRGVGLGQVSRQEFVTLDLAPGAEQQYFTGRRGRLTYEISQRTGFPGLHLTLVGLQCTADELYEAVRRHWPPAVQTSDSQ
jgi:hypothetical protein